MGFGLFAHYNLSFVLVRGRFPGQGKEGQWPKKENCG
jgi:hypothetical protein